MRRFFRNFLTKRGSSETAKQESNDCSNEATSTRVNEVRQQDEFGHIEVGTFIQQTNDVTAYTDDVMVSTQDAEIHTIHAKIDSVNTDVHAQDADVRTHHAHVNAQHVQLNQDIGTFIQHADEVHAEVVNLSTINVVHVHTDELSKTEVDKVVKHFCESVKERSLKEVSGGVTDSYKEQNLTEPKKEFTPQLRKIKFYKGEWVPKTRLQKLKKALNNRKNKYERQTQEYVKEETLVLKENEKQENIKLSEILYFNKHQRYKAIIGQAGSGKTTLMKRLARDVIHGKLVIRKGYNTIVKPEFVHYLNVREIPVSDEITLCDALFGKILVELDEDALKYGFTWLRKNQDKAVFFFDGLDQATWTLKGGSNPMRYEDVASTSTIMKNLLEGYLFPEVLIIISSREHTLSPLAGNLRPHEIFGLAGFSMEDRKQVFIELAGEDGEKLWNLMRTQSPTLIPLGSIPIFLVFIVIVYKFDPVNPPDTMSGVMIKILQIFLQSDHTHERENILQVLNGLKKMSFSGTKEGRVLFTQNDLMEFNLIPNTVRDLVVFVPGSTLLGRNLMEGHYRLFFCHQSVQEMLAALNIIEKDLKGYTRFVKKSLHEVHWSIVRRFVCGVLLNEETCNNAMEDLIRAHDIIEKRSILKQSLCDQLKGRSKQSREQLELFASLYESNVGEFIQSNLSEITIEGLPLTPNDMYAISSLLRRCSEVKCLNLKRCNLSSEAIEILNTGLQSVEVKINQLDLEHNDIAKDDFIIICSILCHCQVKMMVMNQCTIVELYDTPRKVGRLSVNGRPLGVEEISALGSVLRDYDEMDEVVMQGCTLHTEELKSFLEALSDIKINQLDITNNDIMNSGFIVVCSIICQFHVNKMVMDGCTMTTLSNPSTTVGKFHIEKRNLGVAEISALVSVLKRYDELEEVKMWRCELQEDGLKHFAEAVGNVKINRLCISSNDISNDTFFVICSIIRQCQVKEIEMDRCRIMCDDTMTSATMVGRLSIIGRKMGVEEMSTIGSVLRHYDKMKEFRMRKCEFPADGVESFMKAVGEIKIDVFDVSWNLNLGRDGWRMIGSVVHNCQVDVLEMSYCELSADEIEGLEEGLDNSEIRVFEMCGNKNTVPDFWKTVGSIVHKCHIERLCIRGCELSTSDIKSLQESLTDSQIHTFDVRDNYITSDMFILVCSIIRQCQVKMMTMAGATIQIGSTSPKIGRLSIEGRQLTAEELSALGLILREYDVWKEVEILGCKLLADATFLESVADIKIKKLEMSILDHSEVQAITDLVLQCQLERFILWGGDVLPSEDKDLIRDCLRGAKVVFEKPYV